MKKLTLKSLQRILACTVLVLFVSSCGSDNDVVTNIEKAKAVLQSIESGDVTAMQDYINPDKYEQHNLAFPDGVAPLIGAIQSGALDGTTVDNYRAMEDGNTVILQTQYGGAWNNGVPQVGFDVFRFEDGLIVEHWDNLDNVVNDNDGTTQFDGTLTPATNISETEVNREVMRLTGQKIFLEGLWSTILDYFDESTYVQHSTGYGSDIQGLLDLVSTFPDGTPFYQSVKYIYAEGDFVFMMSEGFPDATTGLSTAYFDMFRVVEGKMVEHWDVLQTIPAEVDWANQNGKW